MTNLARLLGLGAVAVLLFGLLFISWDDRLSPLEAVRTWLDHWWQSTVLTDRLAVSCDCQLEKNQTVQDYVAGEVELPEVLRRFRVLYRRQYDLNPNVADSLRGATDEQLYANLALWVEKATRENPSRMAEVLARLGREHDRLLGISTQVVSSPSTLAEPGPSRGAGRSPNPARRDSWPWGRPTQGRWHGRAR